MQQANNEINKSSNQSKSSSHTIAYRTDIDGLRAVSITLVVIGHFWEDLLPSGLIGVNIFFVISGYLISSIIFKEFLNNQFSYRKFYERRVRRIFPSLQIYLVVTFVYIIFKYSDLTQQNIQKIHSHSGFTIASVLMVSNLYQLFCPRKVYNVLATLWSLGVEEQFYLFWPLLASLIIFRKRMFEGVLIISLLIGISFGIRCIVDAKYSITGNVPRRFSLGIFWELFVGCLLAYVETKRKLYKMQEQKQQQHKQIVQNQKQKVSKENQDSVCKETFKLNSILSILAMVVIIPIAFIPKSYQPYRKWMFLISSLAASVLIGCPNQGILTKYFLENRVVVYIGKISYDLYLWHYFIERSFVLHQVQGIGVFLYVLLSVLISIITYEFNERLVRRNSSRWIVAAILIPMLAILISAIIVLCLTIPKESPTLEHHLLQIRTNYK